MKLYNTYKITVLALLFIGLVSCKDGNSVYNPNYEPEKPDPVITSIEPEQGYLSGIDSIIVNGENFSNNPEEITINFDGEAGIVLSSTINSLVVRPAQTVGDSVKVLVSSRGAINFSNPYYYKLESALNPIPGYTKAQVSTAITSNGSGDIIFSLQNEAGSSQGIKVWRATGEVEDYLPSSFNWLSLKIGPDGLLYGVRNNFGVYREKDGAIDTNPFAIGNSSESYRNIDFDEDGFLWVVGDNESIFRVNITNGTITRFPFSANLRAVRVYENKLYVAGTFSETEEESYQSVWVFDISESNELINSEELFSIEEQAENSIQIFEITFDVDGKMYLGANKGTGIYTWTQQQGLEEFYPGLIKPIGYSFTWVDSYLVASITNINIGEEPRHPIKLDVRKEGAPYLGISQ